MEGPPDHQRLIAELSARGFHAAFRRWALGETVFVATALHSEGPLRWGERGAYLVPAGAGLWRVDLLIADDAPVPVDKVEDRVVRLLSSGDEFERECDRRARRLRAEPPAPPPAP